METLQRGAVVVVVIVVVENELLQFSRELVRTNCIISCPPWTELRPSSQSSRAQVPVPVHAGPYVKVVDGYRSETGELGVQQGMRLPGPSDEDMLCA